MQSLSAENEVAISDAGLAGCALPSPADPAEAVRAALCDSDPLARIQAAVQLGEIGNLDDIGLLSDLLSLPTCPDEHAKERAAMVHSMQRLAGVALEPLDLSEVIVLPSSLVGDSNRPLPNPISRWTLVGGCCGGIAPILSAAIAFCCGQSSDKWTDALTAMVWMITFVILLVPTGAATGAIVGFFLRHRKGRDDPGMAAAPSQTPAKAGTPTETNIDPGQVSI